MLSSSSLSGSDLFAEVLAGLAEAPSAVDTLSWVGRTLQQNLKLEQVWIGHPATSNTDALHCYWTFELRSDSTQSLRSSASQARTIRPEILQRMHQSPGHLLWLEPDSPSIWQDVLDPDRPQLLGACYPQGEQPWLLGLVGERKHLAEEERRLQLGAILQLATLALERQALRQREQQQRLTANRWMDRFRVATEATRQVVYEWNIDAEQMEWSSSIRAVFGHPQTEVMETRRWWIDQIHPEDRQRVLRQISQCLDELQVFLCEYRWRRADSYYAWVRDYGRILCGPQGYAVRMIGSLEDISARRRTRKLLRQLRRELQRTMVLSPVPSLIIGTDLQIVEANPASTTLLGYDPESARQMSLARIVHPVDLDADHLQRQQLFQGKIDSFVTEKRMIHRAGHEIPTQLTVSMLGDGVMDREMVWQIRSV